LKKPISIQELCEFVWYLEDKYNLLDFEINGVKPWQSYRIEIYYTLGKYIGVFDNNLKRGETLFDKIKSIKEIILNSIIHNPFKNLKEVDFLLFSHPRSKIVNNQPIDIYTQYFLDENKEKLFLEYEGMFLGKHFRKYKPYKRYLDYINIKRVIFSKLININLDKQQSTIIAEVEKEIYNIIGKHYDLQATLINRTKKFLVTYKLYKKILSITTPKKIYIVVSYGRAELIKAAKELHIKVIELQHGTFSKYHLGYSYPNKKDLDYFPDEFWVWNEYWKNLISFPISKEHIKIYSFKYLEIEKTKYKLQKIPKQMVILGQNGLTDKMAKKVLDNLDFFKTFKIIIKLHPEEYGRSSLYQNMIQLQYKLNIEIVEETDLYALLSSSEYQAGVFSTALYEGVEFDCKTILFDISGIEYMDKFIKFYKVKVI